MDVTLFVNLVKTELGIGAYFGVPDSLLRPLCDELTERFGTCGNHVIAADEGGAVGLAAGHYLASGQPALVYMQNSGIGNAVNPICSLLNEQVYGIPALFVVGWRGEPGVHDEPQHVFQGQCSCDLLKAVGLSVEVIDQNTSEADLVQVLRRAGERMASGKSAALLVRKGALKRQAKVSYARDATLTREQAVEVIVSNLPEDVAIVSTTGKLSRELFEIRERRDEGHERDFLTVGSMGHSSMIGLGVALAQPQRQVFVLDGDGALLMHTGALAIIGSQTPTNLVHILINNQAHDSVGGMPTASPSVDWPAVALACGYGSAKSVSTRAELIEAVAYESAEKRTKPSFIEVQVNLESRSDLGRPTTTALENGRAFADYLSHQN